MAGEGLRARDTLPGDLIVRTALRIPTQLSWRQKRVLKKFAALEQLESDKCVDDIEHENDHRLGVNVVTADKVTNSVVIPDKVDPMQRTITETLRDKLGIKQPMNREKPTYSAGYHRIFRF